MILHHEPGLRGIEIWHGIAQHTSLFDLRDNKARYFAGLLHFLRALHAGEAQTQDPQDTLALRAAREFRRLIVCGGDAAHPALAAVLSTPLPFAVQIVPGPYPGRAGAFTLVAKQGWQRAIALDLGQTQLKVMTAGGNTCVPRDPGQLPFGAHALDSEMGRSRLRAFLRQALPGDLNGSVLALPVALDPTGTARSATYPGLYGPVEPIFAPLFGETPWIVLNDAVLAGLSFRPQERTKTLIVTLGFGVGGALWEF